MPSPRIILYAMPACPHCEAARAALGAFGEPFVERDPAGDPAALREMLTWSPRAAVPTIVVGETVLVGFDAERLDDMLRAAPEAIEPEADEPDTEVPGDDEADGDVE